MPADCVGLKMRTQMSASHGEALSALGFVAIPADVKEFTEQIGGDRFEAQDNPLTNTYNFGVCQYHRYITLSGHFFGASAMIANASWFAGLPANVQSAIDECAVMATAYQHEFAAAEDDVILKKIDPREIDHQRLRGAGEVILDEAEELFVRVGIQLAGEAKQQAAVLLLEAAAQGDGQSLQIGDSSRPPRSRAIEV